MFIGSPYDIKSHLLREGPRVSYLSQGLKRRSSALGLLLTSGVNIASRKSLHSCDTCFFDFFSLICH